MDEMGIEITMYLAIVTIVIGLCIDRGTHHTETVAASHNKPEQMRIVFIAPFRIGIINIVTSEKSVMVSFGHNGWHSPCTEEDAPGNHQPDNQARTISQSNH